VPISSSSKAPRFVFSVGFRSKIFPSLLQAPKRQESETMSAVPTSDDPSPASDPEEVPTPRILWTADSPCFDGLTMSAIVLDKFLQHIRFEEGPLYCLDTKDQVPGTVNARDS
jgi:hypothetical protein